MEPGLLIFLTCVGGLGLILFWFRVLRPALEGLGIVKPYQEIEEPCPPSIMSNSEPRTSTPLVRTSNAEPPSVSKLTEYEMVNRLASLQKVDGSWWFSANKIHEIVGGARNDVLAHVRAVRGGNPHPASDEIITPYAGRRTKASYYPEEPELEYTPPGV